MYLFIHLSRFYISWNSFKGTPLKRNSNNRNLLLSMITRDHLFLLLYNNPDFDQFAYFLTYKSKLDEDEFLNISSF